MGCAELCDGRRYANVTNGRLHGIAYFRHLHDICMVNECRLHDTAAWHQCAWRQNGNCMVLHGDCMVMAVWELTIDNRTPPAGV